ncbi:GNAT family N-acetyltransferase [Cellulomonas sp. JH27-2]|uniref:GNAT family N-acetyltransferase n=1 Tax=Cellulomonas sp. JH27-2 TaxID=2774139 RepID=UPI00177D7059|nr:GNAT family N-acetyltransferase [Cellulomonas sp. JH27-2]
MSLVIRPAQAGDFPALVAVFAHWHDGLVALNRNGHGWLVAELDGAVVGGLLQREFCAWDSFLANVEHLGDADVVPFASLMCIAETHREAGIGTELMTYWIEATPSWAHVIMPDESDDDWSRARRVRFFERLGFVWMPTTHASRAPWLMIRR